MTVGIVINDDWEIAPCLPWARHFAQARDVDLAVVVLVEKGEGDEDERRLEPRSSIGLNALKFLDQSAGYVVAPAVDDSAADSSALEGDDADRLPQEVRGSGNSTAARLNDAVITHVVEVSTSRPTEAVLAEISEQKIELLILPRHLSERGLDPESGWESSVLQQAMCDTAQLRPARQAEFPNSPIRTLTPTDGDSPSQHALRFAAQLHDSMGDEATALYVEPDIDDVAADVGRHIAAKIVERTVGSQSGVQARTMVHTDIARGVIKYAASEIDLVVVGARRRLAGRRSDVSPIPRAILAAPEAPAVVLLRPGQRLTGRLRFAASQHLRRRIPQLDRAQRVSLVERIQGSSQWNFDFVALIFLSTLIASLGLMQNSAAVVIGAMLVAPLMTPLVGAGLALVQGNLHLIARTGRTVLYGFLVAYCLGIGLGLVLPMSKPTAEMLARGSPNVLDLIVAFLSGIAASYAMSRPNLLSALPGVAIAAALVPPVATAGLATALAETPLALGALLLFLTNIVAIVLGTAASLWAVGVRPTHDHGVIKSWVFRLLTALLILTVAIAAYELTPHQRTSTALTAAIEQDLPAQASLLETHITKRGLRVVIGNATPISATTIDRIAATVKRELGADAQVEIETRLQAVR